MVRLIPPGSLSSYADLSALASELGYPCTARRVARALSVYGSDVPWWRVVQASGTIADQVIAEAAPLLRAEGVPVRGKRVPLAQMRWSPEPLALRAEVSDSAMGSQVGSPSHMG